MKGKNGVYTSLEMIFATKETKNLWTIIKFVHTIMYVSPGPKTDFQAQQRSLGGVIWERSKKGEDIKRK